MLSRWWMVCLLMLPASGCSVFGLDEERVIGRIDETDQTRTFFGVPDSIAVGEVFTIRVLTTGDGCDRGGETEVRNDDDRLWVTPYDFSKTDGNCGSLQVFFEHSVQHTTTELGELRVTLVARDLTGEPVERQASIWVH